MRPASPDPRARKPLTDEQAFLRRFLGNPKRTGAVAPSSPFLAREMARAVDPARPGLVVELGPGTGPVTQALLARGVKRERLVLVEFDPHFCTRLGERFPGVGIVRGDAFALAATLAGKIEGPVAAVVSSLPLLNAPPERRQALLDDAFALMGPDGLFVQFTYGLGSPIPREAFQERYVARCGAPVLRNLPPASVWTYRPRDAAPPARGLTLIARAERLGKATETLIERHGDRVKKLIARETAAFKLKHGKRR